jgi:hypothetical protein
MAGKPRHLYVFTAEGPARTAEGTGRRGIHDIAAKAADRGVKIALGTLQNNMRHFLEALDSIVTGSPREVGGLALEEIEVHAQIDGKGNVGIAGWLGAEAALQGGVKFVLRKRL